MSKQPDPRAPALSPLNDSDEIKTLTETHPTTGRSEVAGKTLAGNMWGPHAVDIEPVGKLDVRAFIGRHLSMKKREKGQKHYVDYTQLITQVHPIFEKQSMLVERDAPMILVGDIHGQFSDLMRIFIALGYPDEKCYLFLGDYIDRGPHNLECICLLFAYKCLFPGHITLLRGNHECRNINFSYGFFDELIARMPDRRTAVGLYRMFNNVFAQMPIAAVVGARVLCMHGGISPHLSSLQSIRDIPRPLMDVTGLPLAQDLLWADPDTQGVTAKFGLNAIRGISVQFGAEAVADVLATLKLDLIVRAHQVVQDGYEFFADRKLLTIFSAPKYCDEFDNAAGMLSIDKNLKCSMTILHPIADVDRRKK